MSILICFGTRPEAIKMAPVIHELYRRNIKPVICITAQHREMLDAVLEFFEITPDFDLDLMTSNQDLNYLSASILNEFNGILKKTQPAITLVQGDTTTALMASLASFHNRIPVAHIEAGLRTHKLDAPFPEEANRQLITRVAKYHFAPTLTAQENLIKEGVKSSVIQITGNTIVDAIQFGLKKINNLEVSSDLPRLDEDKKLIVVTGHRRENFGEGFNQICNALKELSKIGGVEIVFPVHLNPRVQEPVLKLLSNKDNIHLIPPLNYPTFLALMQKADLIISDSGGIQEEVPTLNKPLIVTRETSERMESVKAGYAFVTGASQEKIVREAIRLLKEGFKNYTKNPYGDGNAAKKIIDFLHL